MYQDVVDPDVLEAATLVESEYQEFFKKKLEEYGVKSPAELDYDKSQEFFSEIKNEWHGVKESEECKDCEDKEELDEGVEDVYQAAYSHLVNPNTLGVGDVVSFPYSGYETEFKIELIVNPACYGMPTVYHMKALNGPCEGEELTFDEEYIKEAVQSEVKVDESEDDLMKKIIEALNNDEKFESAEEVKEEEEVEVEKHNDDVDNLDDSIVQEEDEKEFIQEEASEEEKKLDEEEQLEESTDFDVTKESDSKLEKILNTFLKAKAMDGDDYEIVSRDKKLILKIFNKKFVKDIEKILGEK